MSRAQRCIAASVLLSLLCCRSAAWSLWPTSPRQHGPRAGRRVLRRAGFSVHSNLDLDVSVPDSDLEAAVPWLLGVGALLGLRQLKAVVDGPEEFQLQPGSLQGRTVLITGGSSGLGFESALRLAEAGARVLVTCRTGEEQLLSALRTELDTEEVEVLRLDLANLQSIRDFAVQCEQLLAGTGIDVVICNAGVMAVPQRCDTSDGFEMQLGVNHLGHFALCGHLLPLLGRGQRTARIICVSSLGHRLGSAARLLQELESPDVASYNAWAAYSDSKLANVIFAKELDRRFRAAGAMASAVSLHPGLCATDLARYVISGKDEPLEVTYSKYAAPIQALLQAARGMLRPVPRGANSQVFLAAGADGGLDQSGGEYFQDMQVAEMHEDASDPELGARLWEASERLTGVRYDFDAMSCRKRTVHMAIGPIEVEAAQKVWPAEVIGGVGPLPFTGVFLHQKWGNQKKE
eukprot:s147_g28.t1